MLTRVIAVLALSTFAACAVPDDSTSCSDGKCDEGGYGETINGLPAAEYYGLLKYEVDQEGDWFRYAGTAADFTLENGTLAAIRLFLLEDGEYYMLYEEWTGSDTSTLVGESVFLQGTWQVDKGTLVVGDLATATGQDVREYEGNLVPGAILTFSRDVRSAGLQDKPMTIGKATSPLGLFYLLDKENDGTCDSDLGEYCAYDDCGPCSCGDGTCQSAAGEFEDTCAADC